MKAESNLILICYRTLFPILLPPAIRTILTSRYLLIHISRHSHQAYY